MDPFEKRHILVCATFSGHTSVFRLARNPLTVQIYDSLSANRKWDEKLRQGMNVLLDATGMKSAKQHFVYQKAGLLRQQDKTSCCVMAFLNVTQLLTGESLDSNHCEWYVAVIR